MSSLQMRLVHKTKSEREQRDRERQRQRQTDRDREKVWVMEVKETRNVGRVEIKHKYRKERDRMANGEAAR